MITCVNRIAFSTKHRSGNLSNKEDSIQCYVTSTFAKELKMELNAVYASDISNVNYFKKKLRWIEEVEHGSYIALRSDAIY